MRPIKVLTMLVVILMSFASLGQTGINSGGGSSGGVGVPITQNYAMWESGTTSQYERFFNDQINRMSTDSLRHYNSKYFQPGNHSFYIDEDTYTSIKILNGIKERKSPIEEYQNFILQYMNNADGSFNRLSNMYSNFINSKRGIIDKTDFLELVSYWHTNLSSPARFPRYQHTPHFGWADIENFNWQRVQEDINTVIKTYPNMSVGWDYYNTDSFTSVNHLMYKYKDRVYFNPFREDIVEIWFNNNDYIDLWDMRESMVENKKLPSMMSLPKYEIESITLKNGEKIFIHTLEFDNLRELSFMPDAFNLEEMLPY